MLRGPCVNRPPSRLHESTARPDICADIFGDRVDVNPDWTIACGSTAQHISRSQQKGGAGTTFHVTHFQRPFSRPIKVVIPLRRV